MSMRVAVLRVTAIGCLCVCLAPARTTSAIDKAELVKKITTVVEQLGDADPINVEAAQIILTQLSPGRFPVLQEVVAKGTFSPVVTERAKKFIESQLPFQDGRKRVVDAKLLACGWARQMALAAYEKAGQKDPKWDDDMRAAITAFTEFKVDWKSVYTPVMKATRSGCHDPYLCYIRGRASENFSDRLGAVASEFSAAARLVTDTDYPAVIKMQCYVAATKTTDPRLMGIVVKDAVGPSKQPWHLAGATWPAVLKEHVPPAVLAELADTFTSAHPASLRKEAFDAIYVPWQQVEPDNVEVLTYKGKFYVDYAWDARGGDWANKVTADGWKLFGERLAIAAEALTAAWEKDHSAWNAATTMLKVELGQGQGRDRMELWFKRAMDANPDNTEACMRKIIYLEPKWHGKPMDMILFARECLAGQNWYGRIPFELEVAYNEMQPYLDNKETFYGSPVIWNDIDALYVPYLRAFPKEIAVRNKYTHFASLAGKWQLAKQQFDVLGNSVNPRFFGGEAALQKFQAMAREKGAALVPPSVP